MNLIDYASNRKFFDQQLTNSHQSSSRLPLFVVEAAAANSTSSAASTARTIATNSRTTTSTSSLNPTSITAAAAFASARIMPTYNNSSSSSNSQSQSNANAGNGSAASPSSCFNMNEYPNDYTDQPVVTNHTGCYSQDANKAFDDVVFDILKVDPDIIAGQLTLIDLPLFKAIEPDELISCKWMSREKLVKAPNIVQFTRRFNQTTFWCQKEILNCKRIETRGKMISHFIKMAKRLNELHSFNSLMAILVALKSAAIYRLKKTWSQHVSKKDVSTFERLADLMFDTSDNKRKIRDMHMNCRLPCIPFLGHFLTDLIHIDIAHPHNSFDNPQRRNQMNNICRLISEYQQSNYQESSSLSCCCGSGSCGSGGMGGGGGGDSGSGLGNSGCTCSHHHYGGGIINSDGTIFINEVSYVKNYLNSFLYIEELQKFKEDENYRDSLELEPDSTSASSTPSVNDRDAHAAKLSDAQSLTPKFNTNDIFSPEIHNSLTIEPALTKSNHLQSSSSSHHHRSNSLVNPVTGPLFVNEPAPAIKFDSTFKNRSNFYLNQANSVYDEEYFNVFSSSRAQNPSCVSSSVDSALELNQAYFRFNGRNLTKNLSEVNASRTKTTTVNGSGDDHGHKLPTLSNCTNLMMANELLGHGCSANASFDLIPNSSTPSASMLIFESPVKRKCIIKNFQKPRFNQWKSYWLQLVGGNLLIYYPSKSMFIRAGGSTGPGVDRFKDVNDLAALGASLNDVAASSASENASIDQHQLQQLQLQLQGKKVNYHKNPCKMHPIASWMVVNLFQDKENEMMATASVHHHNQHGSNGFSSSSSASSSSSSSQNYSKFDIQLNDLNNGNMYKYRFDSLQLAKEWYEQFKLASTYHERQKPDNLIRFD